VEIQQRAVEYSQLHGLDQDAKIALLERMPVLESAIKEEDNKGRGSTAVLFLDSPERSPQSKKDQFNHTKPENESLVDILGTLGIGSPIAPAPAVSNQQFAKDLLGDLFGGGPINPSAPGNMVPMMPTSLGQQPLIADPMAAILGSSAPIVPTSIDSMQRVSEPPVVNHTMTNAVASMNEPLVPTMTLAPIAASSTPLNPVSQMSAPSFSSEPPMSVAPKEYNCYHKSGFKLDLIPTRESPTRIRILAKFTNVSLTDTLSNISFLVAVPKSLKLAMQPPTSTSLYAGASATQLLFIDNPNNAALRLRLKLSYALNNAPVEEILEFSSFDTFL